MTQFHLIFRRSAENFGGISGRRERRARHAGHGAVPLAPELQRQRRRGHAAARRGAGQESAAAGAGLRGLPQRRGEPARLRREPRRLVAHREALRDELLRLSGDYYQDQRRLNPRSERTVTKSPLIFSTTPWRALR